MKTSSVVSRKADAIWRGDPKGGSGIVTFQTSDLKQKRFSLACRLDGNDRSEVNPEELIAAAVASCFSMALSKTLVDRDLLPSELMVNAQVDLAIDDAGPTLAKLSLDCQGTVPGVRERDFDEAVQATRESCPVLRALEPGFKDVEVTSKLLKQ